MDFLAEIFGSLADNPDKTFGIGGGSMVFIISQFISVMRGRNKVDIAQADSETTQAEQETEQLKIQTAATIELAKTITIITEQQGANIAAQKEGTAAQKEGTAAQRDVATILQSLVEVTQKTASEIDDTKTSVSQIELSMGKVMRMVNDVEQSTGKDGEIVALLRAVLVGIDNLDTKVSAWIDEGEHIKKEVADTKERVLDIEKRVTTEHPTVIVPDTQTYTPKEAPEKITGEMKTVGNRTQPIQPPIEEKKEEKSDGKL